MSFVSLAYEHCFEIKSKKKISSRCVNQNGLDATLLVVAMFDVMQEVRGKTIQFLLTKIESMI